MAASLEGFRPYRRRYRHEVGRVAHVPRHVAFAENVFERLMVEIHSPRPLDRKRVFEIARASLHPSGMCLGIKLTKMDGTTDKRATIVAKTLLGMPSIQAALDEKFNAAGLTLDHCAGTMKAIVDADEGDAALMAVKLKAIDMRVKMTVGYAPTRTDNVNMNVAGRAFNAEEWEKVPAIETTTQEPKSITATSARRGGKKRR